MVRTGWLGGTAALALTLAAGQALAATEIQLWHAMSGANTQRIEAIAEGFNQRRPTTRSSPASRAPIPRR